MIEFGVVLFVAGMVAHLRCHYDGTGVILNLLAAAVYFRVLHTQGEESN